MMQLKALFVGAALLSAATLCAQAPSAQAPSAPARDVILTGEVEAADAQLIIVPPSQNSPVVIRYFVPEGQAVKKGDVVLRIDGSQQQSALLIQQQLEQAKARAAKDIGLLQVAYIDAEIALAAAQSAMQKAAVDEKLPKQFLSALDFDRYQNEAERTRQDVKQKQQALAAASVGLSNAGADADAEQKKLAIELAYSKSLQARAEVIAQVDGIVVHGFSEWRGRRVDEGESVHVGTEAGRVVSGSRPSIVAYALEADRVYLREQQPVSVFVDALAYQRFDAVISSISPSPETRAVWGQGRYFKVRIDLETGQTANLVPGMSVRVEPRQQALSPVTVAASRGTQVALDGEIGAAIKSAIAPPSIRDIWQYTLVMLAPEGTLVRKGQPVAVFDGKSVRDKLSEKQRKQDEVQKQLRQLELSHAEAEKQSEIATAEARAALEKASRKAAQPAELIKRVDYDKLVIEQKLATGLLRLAEQKQVAQAAARSAERKEKQVELALANEEIAELEKALQQLSVKPGNDGIVIHGQAFNGDKFTTGSQVYQGLAVASVADARTLRVDATVAEADAGLLAIGQSATVRYGNAGASLPAKISALGAVFRRKGRTQPVIVRDVTLSFESGATLPLELKPGLAVQISVALSSSASAAARAAP
jgi:multidrug resistance efflux pump